MISNLNQLSFQRYGSITPERRWDGETAGKLTEGSILELGQNDASVYVSESPIKLRNHSGMTVLAVSVDGELFQHFYLDKIVDINPGVRFALSAFEGTSSVELWGGKLTAAGCAAPGSDQMVQRRIHISGIYTFFYQEKEKGFIFPGEAHRPLELTYVDKGSIHSVADGKDLLLRQGEMVIYAPNQWHMQYADVEVSPSYITITFDMEGMCPEELFNKKFTIPQSAVSILQRMMKEHEYTDDYSGDMLISLLQALLLTLLREQASPGTGKLRTANSVNNENEIIRRAQQYVSTHVREKLTVPVVARHVDVSPSYLTALFRKNLQISPGEYIRRVKLQESKKMIREDNMNFTQIAAVLQYSTVHHFSRQFKEKFGITPTEYAKSVR